MRAITRLTVCALMLMGGVAGIRETASAAPSGGATGLHDGMMPADSPDAHMTLGGSVRPQATAAAVAPAPLGVDVSGHQHASGATITWSQVAGSGRQFAIVKATELYTDDVTGQPVLYTNPYFSSDLVAAHGAGLTIASYAFAHPENDAVTQADDFADTLATLPGGGLPPGSLPPVLDLEVTGGLTPTQLVAWTHAFLDRLQTRTGVLPMIYASPNFWNVSLGNSTAFTRYPLWEAHYTTAAAPYAMGGWPTWTLWQFTDGSPANAGLPVPGIAGYADQDRFNSATGATLSNLHLPTGSIDGVTADGTGRVSVNGWTIDPDAPATSTRVDVYLDGAGQSVTANQTRTDVGATYPLAGNQHGYTATAQTGPGAHTVCVYAGDTAVAQRSSLGCRTVTVTPTYPTGAFESATADGTGRIALAGWAIDTDTPTAPVRVNVSVDGATVTSVSANGSRPDIGATHPTAGNLHGFTATAQAGPGAHTVCVSVVDTSFPSRIPRLGCRTVTVTPRYPIGSFEAATVDSSGHLSVRGWSFDPDTPTAAVRAYVYVDGRGLTSVVANGSRPDVGRIYPAAGSLHGFTATGVIARGSHSVCIYVRDTSFPSRMPRLGCRTVG